MGNVSLVDGHIDEPRMTDEQIIKALECCKDLKCSECPLFMTDCDVKLCQEAIDIINRQKAEIEKKNIEIDILISKKDMLQDENSELMAEVESLKEALKDLKIQMSYMVNPNSIGDRHEMGCW